MNIYLEVPGILLLVNFPPASFILYLKFYQYNANKFFDIVSITNLRQVLRRGNLRS